MGKTTKSFALSLAMAFTMVAPVLASDWYRVQLDSPIFFSGESAGVNINVEDAPVSRIYGEVVIPVSVDGAEIDHTISIANLPSGASWTPTSGAAGTITWTGAVAGGHSFVVEVRDSDDRIVASQGVELTVFEELIASIPETEYEVNQGDALTITPLVENAIGIATWGLSETHAWLNVNGSTGVIDVDTSQANSVQDLFLIAADSFDNATTETSLFSIAVNSGIGEYWVSTISGPGNDYARDVKIGPDGSIYLVGEVTSPQTWESDFFIAKYSPEGQIIWQRTLSGGEGRNWGRSLEIAANGDVYATGTIRQGGGYSLLIAKYKSNGDLEWYRTYGGLGNDLGEGVVLASDGSIYIGGTTASYGNGAQDFLIAKINSSGDLGWQRLLGGGGSDFAYGIAIDADDAVYIYGETLSSGSAGNRDILLAKYTSNGTQSWKYMVGGISNDGIRGAVVYGNYLYMIGYTSQNNSINGSEVVLMRMRTDGDLGTLTRSLLGSSLNENGIGITSDGSGSFYLTGSTTGDNGLEVFVAKYSSQLSGTSLLWQRTLSGSRDNVGNAIAVGDGYIYVAGETKNFGIGFNTVFLAKLPIDGGSSMEGENFSWSPSSMITSGINFSGQVTPTWGNQTSSLEVELDDSGLVEGDGDADSTAVETLE